MDGDLLKATETKEMTYEDLSPQAIADLENNKGDDED